MPLSIFPIMLSNVSSLLPGTMLTFGRRWNCTSAQLCAYEQPYERTGLPTLV